MTIIDQPQSAVIAQQTSWDDGHLITVHNLGSDALVLPLQLVDLPADIVLVDLLHDGSVDVDAQSRCVINLDPYGFRCLPQIHGPAQDAADALEDVLAVEINAAAENPLISAEDMAAYHHGGFYQAQLALALDHFRLAVTQVARLSTSRLSTLNEPAYTRLRPFLADCSPRVVTASRFSLPEISRPKFCASCRSSRRRSSKSCSSATRPS